MRVCIASAVLPPHTMCHASSHLKQAETARAAFEALKAKADAALDEARQKFATTSDAFNRAKSAADAGVRKAQADVDAAQAK